MFGGIIFLVFGALIYILDRPAGNIFILTEYISGYHEGKSVFGDFGFYLPTFFHVVGFSIITKNIFYSSKRSNYVIPLFWGSVNALFEFGQLYFSGDSLQYKSYYHLGNTFNKLIYGYFSSGTFDWFDICAAITGVIFCLSLFGFMYKKEDTK